ncbi:Replication termination factor 2 [Batrachochytrium dendrobatidis]|nr:Replication termination factor 2 [Batrachochytrium dendrobatidis]KAK5668582.1 Replication termination factor 2 [Batrachochytrium dendrobatidis]
MGCDGGSIPKRGELVKTKKAAEKPDAASQTLATWFFCALSKLPLQVPVVACGYGRLYNKSAVLEFLIDPTKYGDGDVVCSHIQSLKDVTTLNLSSNPAYSSQSQSASVILGSFSDQASIPQFCCPITQKEMNGKSRFVCIRSCGCVLSEQAMKEVASTSCLVCGQPFKQADVFVVNPSLPEDITAAFLRVKELKMQDMERKRIKRAEKEAKKEAKQARNNAQVDKAKVSGSDEDLDKTQKKDRKRSAFDNDNLNDHHENGTAHRRPNKVAQNINMTLPDLAHLQPGARPVSDTIKSLYVKRDKDGKSLEKQGNFLVRGTFNRFATGF